MIYSALGLPKDELAARCVVAKVQPVQDSRIQYPLVDGPPRFARIDTSNHEIDVLRAWRLLYVCLHALPVFPQIPFERLEFRGKSMRSDLFHRFQRGHSLDAVPQALQADVLVRRVLVVVVVSDRHHDRVRVLKLYCARHTFGTVAMAETRNPGLVKEVMGHESLSTTMIYLHPETAQIKNVIDRRNQQKDLGFPTATKTATVVQREGCDQP